MHNTKQHISKQTKGVISQNEPNTRKTYKTENKFIHDRTKNSTKNEIFTQPENW